ncbi:signal peptide peptidase SppA [Cetobacterium sp. SF1]|uniref:signal peptide peptidase SppA n=1 Tax=Cetobacterium sp. SF1 TaxID=3417654 RepID=UPI003CF2E9EF
MIILRILKNIILFFIKEIIKIGILLFILGVGIMYTINYFSKTKEIKPIENNSYLELNLANGYNESGTNPLDYFSTDKTIDFYTLLSSITKAKNDNRIDGIFINLENSALNKSQVEELGQKLLEFKKSGKKIYAYGANLDNNNYNIAIYANEIIMPPSASATVNITGFYNQIPYFKNLSNLVGVKFNVIHVGDYKSYGENYVKNEMSHEFKENMLRIYDKVYNNFVGDIAKERQLSSDNINEKILNGDLMVATPYDLIKNNLIDKMEYLNNIKEELGKDNFVKIEDYGREKNISSENDQSPAIALIYLNGDINYNDDSRNLTNKITPKTFADKFQEALDDDDIKGIVLRVNSPGGSALASEIIYNQIKASSKPVYISIGRVAASGGYYISSAGKKIFADRDSITGSIGVVSLIPNIQELVHKLHINLQTLEKGKFASIYSLTNNFTEEDKEKMYKANEEVYKEFLERVSSSRGISVEELNKIAQGRVWLGEEAVNIGLVDQIGGIEDTISAMGEDLSLEKYRVKEIKTDESINNFISSYMGPVLEVKNIIYGEKADVILKNIKNNELYFKPTTYFPYEI